MRPVTERFGEPRLDVESCESTQLLIDTSLPEGAIVVADNADHSPDYLARVRAADSGFLSLPFGEDVELTMRLA